MLAIIIANGNLQPLDQDIIRRNSADLLIAADGGGKHCLSVGVIPDLVIGDFDSLSEQNLNTLMAQGADTDKHPISKDETDLELALHESIARGADRIQVYGALGDRWDMNLGNLLLLAHPALQKAQIELIWGYQCVTLIKPNSKHQIQGSPGDIISLIPIQGDAEGIRTEGLEYPLRDERLLFGATRGVSNILINHKASVSLNKGFLICVRIESTGTNNQR